MIINKEDQNRLEEIRAKVMEAESLSQKDYDDFLKIRKKITVRWWLMFLFHVFVTANVLIVLFTTDSLIGMVLGSLLSAANLMVIWYFLKGRPPGVLGAG